MIKKEVKYEDMNGDERNEVLYFGFKKSELIHMQQSVDGGLENRLKKIIETDDQPKIMDFFRTLILDSYGEKSEDGKIFRKNDQIREDFENSEAFDVIYVDILSDVNKAVEFVKGIMPKGVEVDVSAEMPAVEDLRKKLIGDGVTEATE